MSEIRMGTRSAPPNANFLIESLRSMGYSLKTALCDLIDNSISANASSIDVHFKWAGAGSWIRILDDGDGMNDSQLEAAMRLGAKDPQHQRASSDLGRFGMGLKTASFSQARRLTVCSKTSSCNAISSLQWDLDRLSTSEGGWSLIEGVSSDSHTAVSALEGYGSGSLVLLEKLDRIVVEDFNRADLFAMIDEVEAFIGMTYHRFLEELASPLIIRINGKKVEPWDPFLTGNPSKALEKRVHSVSSSSGAIQVQCHVLPHHDLIDEELNDYCAGPAGWIAQQGFYIYRNRRLIVSGGWMRLQDASRYWANDEMHRLARIRLDIPNTADEEWGINVMKSTATLPLTLRPELKILADEARRKSRQVITQRSSLIRSDSPSGTRQSIPAVWQARKGPRGTTYRVFRKHVLVSAVLRNAGQQRDDIEALLGLIEGTVPIQKIWIDQDKARSVQNESFHDAGIDEMKKLFEALIKSQLQNSETNRNSAIESLLNTPAFHQHYSLIKSL